MIQPIARISRRNIRMAAWNPLFSDQIAGLERVLELSDDHQIAAVLMSFGDGKRSE